MTGSIKLCSENEVSIGFFLVSFVEVTVDCPNLPNKPPMKKKLPGIILSYDYFYSKGCVWFNAIHFNSTFLFNIHFIETMLVGKVKAMLQRIYKGDPATLKLTYTSHEVSRLTIETDVFLANIYKNKVLGIIMEMFLN